MEPGHEQRIDYEYVRNGVCNILMANEPLKDKRLVKITERKTKIDWADFVNDISLLYPNADKITPVMDNFKTHVSCALYEKYSP